MKPNSQEHRRPRSGSADLLSMAGVLVVSSILLFEVMQDLAPALTEQSGWKRFVFEAMLGYLFFVTLRSFVLIILSFADRFFRSPADPNLKVFPLVSLIVPCFNEEAVVQAAVNSLLELEYPNLEILVVDDGSTDLTFLQAKALEQDRRVRVIYQRNQGKATALNRGIYEAQGEYVLCVDADSVLYPDVVARGISYFVRDPSLAAVAGSVHVGNVRTMLARFQSLEYVVGLNFHKSAQSFLSAVTIIPGPIGLFRRGAILSVGGYQTSTFAEDCDLTIRLLLAGYHTAFCPEMIAVTEAPEDFESLLKQRYRWSRGTLQAIKSNAYWLTRPWKNTRNTAVLLYMLTETLVIPCANFLFAIAFIHQALNSNYMGQGVGMLGPFFAQLTLLDVILTAYSVIFERSVVSLVMLATVNRITYGLAMEVLRFFSVIDEVAGLPMNWNKLERKGL